jgi:hypothetical protein
MLTELEERLAEAHGLAIGADVVTAKVLERIDDPALRADLHRLARDAAATRARCLDLEQRYDEDTTAELLHRIDSAKNHSADLVHAWFKAGTGPLAAWTFLAMAEAAEVAAWSMVTVLATRGRDAPLCELAAWALEVQEGHLRIALEGSVLLAEQTDPDAPRWG